MCYDLLNTIFLTKTVSVFQLQMLISVIYFSVDISYSLYHIFSYS